MLYSLKFNILNRIGDASGSNSFEFQAIYSSSFHLSSHLFIGSEEGEGPGTGAP